MFGWLVNWSERALSDTTGSPGTLRGQELLAFLCIGVEWIKRGILAARDNGVSRAAGLGEINAMNEEGSVREAINHAKRHAISRSTLGKIGCGY